VIVCVAWLSVSVLTSHRVPKEPFETARPAMFLREYRGIEPLGRDRSIKLGEEPQEPDVSRSLVRSETTGDSGSGPSRQNGRRLTGMMQPD